MDPSYGKRICPRRTDDDGVQNAQGLQCHIRHAARARLTIMTYTHELEGPNLHSIRLTLLEDVYDYEEGSEDGFTTRNICFFDALVASLATLSSICTHLHFPTCPILTNTLIHLYQSALFQRLWPVLLPPLLDL